MFPRIKHRRDWLKHTGGLSSALVFGRFHDLAFGFCENTVLGSPNNNKPAIRHIGSRRELFVDHYLIEKFQGTELKLHEPQLAPPMDLPADNLEYGTVIMDRPVFRLYTREARNSRFDGDTTEVTRYFLMLGWLKPPPLGGGFSRFWQ